jgi:spermidine synthase
MNSATSRSELALARIACEAILDRDAPQVLIGGLGLGLTLRAALDALPPGARITVAELTKVVKTWCRGPASSVSRNALADPRVWVVIEDVAETIARATMRFDAIVLDLYEGPHEATQTDADPFYGSAALTRTRNALRRGGVLAVWSEEPDAPFARRLARVGFDHALYRPGKGGRRHAVYLCRVVRALPGWTRGMRCSLVTRSCMTLVRALPGWT